MKKTSAKKPKMLKDLSIKPPQAEEHKGGATVCCTNNLKQIGIAVH